MNAGLQANVSESAAPGGTLYDHIKQRDEGRLFWSKAAGVKSSKARYCF